MNGVTSNGIFSRSATAPTGLLLMSSSLSFHGSSFTRPPIGSAVIVCWFFFTSASSGIADLDGFRVGGLLLVDSPRKSKMAEGFLVLNQQLIEKSIRGIEAMAENGVAKLVRYDGR